MGVRKIIISLEIAGLGGGEVQDIPSQLNVTFNHVVQKESDTADGLTRKEVFRLNISFNI